MYRERERKTERDVYIYIYTYIAASGFEGAGRRRDRGLELGVLQVVGDRLEREAVFLYCVYVLLVCVCCLLCVEKK